MRTILWIFSVFVISSMVDSQDEDDEIHERNYFMLSSKNADKCRDICENMGGFPCAEDFSLPEDPKNVHDNSQYSITVVCCNKPCTEPSERDIDHPLPFCEGDFLDFIC